MISLIARAVAADLVFPKGREPMPPDRESPSMPEVAIHENGEMSLGNNKVRLSRQARFMASKRQSGGFCQLVHITLGGRVFPLYTRHDPAALRRRHYISHGFDLK